MTIGCLPEERSALAGRLRQLLKVTGIPARVVVHRDGGVGVAWLVRGQGCEADRLRSQAHWAFMDAEAVLGLRSWGAFASGCTTCGATCAEYEHTPAFCGGLVALASEWDVALKFVLARCGERDCNRWYPGIVRRRDGKRRLFPGLCDACDERLAAEIEVDDE